MAIELDNKTEHINKLFYEIKDYENEIKAWEFRFFI